MKWTDSHDTLLLRDILFFEPWKYRHGSMERGNVWESIAESLNQIKSPSFKVNQRSVRERYQLLETKFKERISEENKASGINPNPQLAEIDMALQDITERFAEADRKHKQLSEEKKRKIEEDVQKAEEMRKRSMESMGESQKRKKKLLPSDKVYWF